MSKYTDDSWKTDPACYDATFELHPDDIWPLIRPEEMIYLYVEPNNGPTSRYDLQALEGKRILFTTQGDKIAIGNVCEVIPPSEEHDDTCREGRWTIGMFNEEENEFVLVAPVNRGPGNERLTGDYFTRLEESFARQWEAENQRVGGMYDNVGLLQSLVAQYTTRRSTHDAPVRTEYPFAQTYVTQRERHMVAMIVQWLGSNVGSEFMIRCMEDVGFRVTHPENRQNPTLRETHHSPGRVAPWLPTPTRPTS